MNVGMVFAIIFAVIVIVFVLAFGMDSITRFFCYSSETQTQKAINDIKAQVEEIYVWSEGAGKSHTLLIPSDNKFCFVDPSNPEPNTARGWDPDEIIQDIIMEKSYNLWYFHCLGQSGYNIPHLKTASNFCIKSGVELYMQNNGDHVGIEIIR